jgi:hypothetical protein
MYWQSHRRNLLGEDLAPLSTRELDQLESSRQDLKANKIKKGKANRKAFSMSDIDSVYL